jgi:hypothetical protein
MPALTSGNKNVALNAGALERDTDKQNIAIGPFTLHNNTKGNENVAIGEATLDANTTACCNVALGLVALADNTIGAFNIATGYFALRAESQPATTTSGPAGIRSSATPLALKTSRSAASPGKS